MDVSFGGNDALVVLEGPPLGKIDRFAVTVGNDAARFGDQNAARGVVLSPSAQKSQSLGAQFTYPNLLFVCGARGQAQVNVSVPPRDGAVLGLRVHTDRGLLDAKDGSDSSIDILIRVTRFYGLTKSRFV